MTESTYEVIDYSGTNYKFLTGYVNYVMPHLHREIEVGLVLDGEMVLNLRDGQKIIQPGGIWLMNPFQNHGTNTQESGNPYLYVNFQLSRGFFRAYFPQINQLEFMDHVLTEEQHGKENLQFIRLLLLEAAYAYYKKMPNYQLKCAAGINAIFARILECADVRLLEASQVESNVQRNLRMQKINEYIEQNFDRKLLLEEIARIEGLSLHYMSHFFKDNWGMPFQKYLLYFRCEKARELLLSTQMSITDISFSCGFSDPKYLRQGFRELYNMEPSAMRRMYEHHENFDAKSTHVHDSRRLTREEALEVLGNYISKEKNDMPRSILF